MSPHLALATINLNSLAATVVYSLVGILLMIAGVVVMNLVFGLDLKRELTKENNVAFGTLFGGVAIGISIIVAAAIF